MRTNRKIVVRHNLQANSMIELFHQMVANMIRTRQIWDKHDVDPQCGFSGMLAACRRAMNSTVHATSGTLRATHAQLVFRHNAFLNVHFEADWQCIKE